MRSLSLHILISLPRFVDFQNVPIQAELPWFLDILRAVETPEPGDRCDYTGTLIVVPDVCSLNLPTAQAESSNRHEGEQGEGVKGLKMVFVVLTRSGHYTRVNEIRLGSKPH